MSGRPATRGSWRSAPVTRAPPAAVIGDGAAGVVFLNTAQNDLCAWEPYAREIARHGARSVLFEYAGGDHVAEALAAVRMLRADGAAQVSLVGGSLGAMVAIAAAARAPRELRSIVSLSPLLRDATGDYLRPARRNRVPSLYVSARNDGWTTFGAETRRPGSTGSCWWTETSTP